MFPTSKAISKQQMAKIAEFPIASSARWDAASARYFPPRFFPENVSPVGSWNEREKKEQIERSTTHIIVHVVSRIRDEGRSAVCLIAMQKLDLGLELSLDILVLVGSSLRSRTLVHAEVKGLWRRRGKSNGQRIQVQVIVLPKEETIDGWNRQRVAKSNLRLIVFSILRSFVWGGVARFSDVLVA